MHTVFVVILTVLVLVILLNMLMPKSPSHMCAPGYMPTGSGCVPTNEEIGIGPHP